MKKIQKIYLPGTAMAFMLTILLTAVIDLLNGTYNYDSYVFELFGFLAAVEAIDYLISFINFKKYIHYFVSELVIIYVFMLGAGYIFHWYDFSSSMVTVTVIFLLIYSFIHWHFYKLFKQEAAYINELIESRNKLVK